MTFKKAKRIVTLLLLLAVVVCIIGLITFDDGDIGLEICVVIAVVMVAVALAACWAWCKCPYCGMRILRKVLSLKACPHCGKDFESGKKIQKIKKN